MHVDVWLSTALRRWFPRSAPGSARTLRLPAARGEQISFQACVRLAEGTEALPASAELEATGDLEVRLRRVGYVPMPHHNTATPDEELDGLGHIPGHVPDPLSEDLPTTLAPREALSYWVTVRVPSDVRPGPRRVTAALRVGETTRRLTATVDVSPVVLQPRRDFPVTHWFYADALCDWYGVSPWSPGFWPLCRRYFLNFADHGFDTLLTPLFTPPLDGVKRPTQLLRVTRARDRYAFDWTDVDRWVKLARGCGIERFEWSHFFTQWGVKHALRVYEGQGLDERLLWKPTTGATSPTYRAFLAQLLPELKAFLTRRKLMERSFFHVSDEPHGEEHLRNYMAARALLRCSS